MNFLGDVKVNKLQLLIHFHESLTIDMSNLKKQQIHLNIEG